MQHQEIHSSHAGCFGRNLFLFMILALLTLPALAQDAKEKKESSDVSVNRVEVKDGKVYVNGEMVKELENADARVVFSRDGDRDVFFLSDKDGTGLHNFAYRSPDFNGFVGGNGAVGWVGGNNAESMALFNRLRDAEPLAGRLELLRENGLYGMLPFEANDEIRELEARSQELARRLRQADGDDAAALNQQLEDLLGQIFDKKLDEQRSRIDTMSKELAQLRSRVDERSNARSQIIERRLRQLKGERDTLDW